MVIECCGYDQILDCLNQSRNVPYGFTSNNDLAHLMFEKFGNGKACVELYSNMTFQGWDCREYFEAFDLPIYSYEEVFGEPEEFGQITLEEVLYV